MKTLKTNKRKTDCLHRLKSQYILSFSDAVHIVVHGDGVCGAGAGHHEGNEDGLREYCHTKLRSFTPTRLCVRDPNVLQRHYDLHDRNLAE